MLSPNQISKDEKGFTLLELLVAMAIFALMAALAYGGLNIIMKERQATEQHADRLAQLQRSFLWLGRDIEQTVNRPVRDEYGAEQDAFLSAEFGRYQLELTRGGWRNPAGRTRTNLQRVAYKVEEEKLIRSYWNVLDRSQDSQPLETVLLDGVTKMELRFLSQPSGQNQYTNNWTDVWPDSSGSQSASDLPRAVEVTLETEAEGRITRRFRVPG